LTLRGNFALAFGATYEVGLTLIIVDHTLEERADLEVE
jgi:hypothetical protein